MRRARAAFAAAVLAAAATASFVVTARADDRPLVFPTRDVDVTYAMVQADAPGGPRLLRQRLRYAVAARKLRVDPPTPGLYMIVDFATHHLETIRESERMVMEMDAPGTTAAMQPGLPPPGARPGGGGQGARRSGGASFRRHGDAQVAGIGCTEWETTDAAGEAALVCLTADGVMLRAAGGGRVLLEATQVVYGPIDPSVFSIPPDYTRLTPPPLSRAVPLQNPPTMPPGTPSQ